MSWEEWIIGCGVDSVCATAIVWRSKGAGRLGGAEKSFSNIIPALWKKNFKKKRLKVH